MSVRTGFTPTPSARARKPLGPTPNVVTSDVTAFTWGVTPATWGVTWVTSGRDSGDVEGDRARVLADGGHVDADSRLRACRRRSRRW